VQSTGANKDKFRGIDEPLTFRRQVQQAIERKIDQSPEEDFVTPAPASSPGSENEH
jgi:hypothetical protein